MTEVEFEDYLLFTTSFPGVADGSCTPNKPTSIMKSLSMENSRISLPPSTEVTIPKRSPARLFERWKLPSQRLMNVVSNTKVTAANSEVKVKDTLPYIHKKNGAPDSPQSFLESTSSFEIEDDEVKGDEGEICFSSNSDNESVFSNPGSIVPEPQKTANSVQTNNHIYDSHEEDEEWEELLHCLETIQICKIDDVVTIKHSSNTGLARVKITAPSPMRTVKVRVS